MYSTHLICLSAALAVAASAGCSSTDTTPATKIDAGEVPPGDNRVVDPIADSGTPTPNPADATAPVTPPDGGSARPDGGTARPDGGTGGPDAAAALNGCTTYVDHTAGNVLTLAWDFPIASDPNRCSKIKAGAKVTWTGGATTFTTHPLAALGGTTPTPIAGKTGTDASYTVTFPAAGTFGYVCTNHSNMKGAILVVP